MIDARERAELRASEHLLTEAREAWQSIGGTDARELSGSDCARAFEALGLRGVEVRGMLPGSPAILRRLYSGGDASFSSFAEAYSCRMSEYDGPVCMLCFARESTNLGRGAFECQGAEGECSVFSSFTSSKDNAHSDGNVAVAALPAAVLACLSFRAGIEPRLGVEELKICERSAHSEWRQATARVVELATASLPAERVSMREAQEAVENGLLQCQDERPHLFT